MRSSLYLFLVTLLLYASQVFGYANFIGHGYTTCLTCHFNPWGGGPINDYGRVVSATAISSRAITSSLTTDERAAYLSGFLFRPPKQKWLRTQINYRGFQLVRNPGSTLSEQKQWINMQLDGRLILKFGENDKFISVLNYGYAPKSRSMPSDVEQPEWRTREHYVGYRFTPKLGIYAGLMDKVFGLKVIEHIAFSRSYPQISQNDQVHGVAAHYLEQNWELGAHGFVGNLAQEEDVRMKGLSITGEKTIFLAD